MSKSDFPLLTNRNIAYFDSAATTQKPQVVIDTLKEFYENTNANAHRSVYPLAQEATNALEEARATIAAFINASPDEIIFTKNTTESLNLLAYAIPHMNTVITTMFEHHSNFLPWQQHTESFVVCESFEEIAQRTNDQTTLVTFTGMSNVTGIIPDTKQIIADVKAKNNNIVTVIDACQLIAHKQIDVKDLNCDALAFSAHKLYGPLGVGVLYIKKSLQEKLSPFILGGGMVESVSEREWHHGPQQFEAGTQDVPAIVAAAKAIEYFKEHVNYDKERKLKDEFLGYLEQEDITVIGHRNDQEHEYGPIISLAVPSAYDVATLLGEQGVCVRSGHHCAQPLLEGIAVGHTLRISIGMYNNEDDITRFKEAFKKVKQQIPVK